MNRYFYYNVLLVSLLNLMIFVPHVLLKYRYDGAVMSMLVAVLIGSLFAYMYTYVMQTFPGKGVPEMLYDYFPKAVAIPYLIMMAVMWFIASAIAIVAYAVLINRLLNPDTSPIIVLVMLTIVCVYTSTRSTMTILFIIEMGLLINTPLVLFILMKAARSKSINWDAIMTVTQYWNQAPKILPVAAATYVFTGYINYAIYNRVNPPNFRMRYRWMIPLMGTFILLMSFFVPIGFHGTEMVDNYLYVWSVTADSLIMNYGFIERVIFVFLILYLNLTLIYTASGWHQAIEFIRCCMPGHKPSIDPDKTPRSNWYIGGAFALVSIAYLYLFNEKQNYSIASYWLVIRLFIEAASVSLFFFISIRKRRASS